MKVRGHGWSDDAIGSDFDELIPLIAAADVADRLEAMAEELAGPNMVATEASLKVLALAAELSGLR